MERNSFLDLLKVCNPHTKGILEKGAISKHLRKVFLFHQDLLKENNILENVHGVAYTLETWTAPNLTTFMAITAHIINETFGKVEILLRVPHITGDNFLTSCLERNKPLMNMFCRIIHWRNSCQFAFGYPQLLSRCKENSVHNHSPSRFK
jgi:hypothetical protein